LVLALRCCVGDGEQIAAAGCLCRWWLCSWPRCTVACARRLLRACGGREVFTRVSGVALDAWAVHLRQMLLQANVTLHNRSVRGACIKDLVVGSKGSPVRLLTRQLRLMRPTSSRLSLASTTRSIRRRGTRLQRILGSQATRDEHSSAHRVGTSINNSLRRERSLYFAR
jgi:hypothetical protein